MASSSRSGEVKAWSMAFLHGTRFSGQAQGANPQGGTAWWQKLPQAAAFGLVVRRNHQPTPPTFLTRHRACKGQPSSPEWQGHGYTLLLITPGDSPGEGLTANRNQLTATRWPRSRAGQAQRAHLPTAPFAYKPLPANPTLGFSSLGCRAARLPTSCSSGCTITK